MTLSPHVAAARARKLAEAEALGIDDAFIARLVEDFYAAIHADAMLGPIFAKQITDWPRHLSRMKDFWASIMLESGRFSGTPMQTHIAIGGLDAPHFAHWLALWDQALVRVAPNMAVTERFRAAARRIGESLLIGIQIDRGGPPAIATRAG